MAAVLESTANLFRHSSSVRAAFAASVATGPTSAVLAATVWKAAGLLPSAVNTKSNDTDAVGTMLVTLAACWSLSTFGNRPKSSTRTATGLSEATDTMLSLIIVTTMLASRSLSTPCRLRRNGSTAFTLRFVARSANAAGSTFAVSSADGNLYVSKKRNRMRTLRRSTPVSTELRSNVTLASPAKVRVPAMFLILLVSTIVFFLTDW